MSLNPVGLQGIDFIEFASPEPERLDRLFRAFGFSRTLHHPIRRIDLYEQGDIRLLLNRGSASFASGFSALHGPSICSMGWRVHDGQKALAAATARGARSSTQGDLFFRDGRPVPAVYGIGESLIYLVDGAHEAGKWERLGFVPHPEPVRVASKGFTLLDHLTHNVEKGTMARWASFYKDIFGFTEVRYFDIRGVMTGLTSYALRSPCGTFCIPINEADEKKSQINEYLEEYKGPGVQHLAFLTNDILGTLRALESTDIEMLDMDDAYYREAFERVPQVTEDREEIRRRQVLVDGDEEGYLLQIFTRNIIGPIFIEIIQRKNHLSFGEGNFSALFRSIEREQAKRGVFAEAGRS